MSSRPSIGLAGRERMRDSGYDRLGCTYWQEAETWIVENQRTKIDMSAEGDDGQLFGG